MQTHSKRPDSAPVLAASEQAGSITKPLMSHDLFGRRRDVCIKHNEKLYTLRITANNKLILVA